MEFHYIELPKYKKKESSKDELKDYQLIRALDLVKALYLYGQNDNLSAQTAQKAEKAKQGKK